MTGQLQCFGLSRAGDIVQVRISGNLSRGLMIIQRIKW